MYRGAISGGTFRKAGYTGKMSESEANVGSKISQWHRDVRRVRAAYPNQTHKQNIMDAQSLRSNGRIVEFRKKHKPAPLKRKRKPK
jgi:hypothetical protein